MRYTFRFGAFFGIPLKIHITFPLILVLFGLEAGLRGGWSDALWAVMLVLAVFACVVLHELGHSLQVRRYGIEVRDIVLLPIGGMARAQSIPENPWQEIVVAISGPLVNFSLAALLLPYIIIRGSSLDFESDFVANLFSINIVLGTFNLIPAFPMDGGRILRGILAVKMDYLRATHHAKNVGQAIAILFAVVGFVYTNFIMLPLIAVVVFFGAMSEENMVRTKVNLRGKAVRDFLRGDVPIFHMDDTLASVTPYMGDPSVTAFPVSDLERRIPGAVSKKDVIELLRSRDGMRVDAGIKLGELMRTDFPLVEGSTPAIQVYYYLKSENAAVAGVVENGAFSGLVTMVDLVKTAGGAGVS
jgi:Zn-dependent protease